MGIGLQERPTGPETEILTPHRAGSLKGLKVIRLSRLIPSSGGLIEYTSTLIRLSEGAVTPCSVDGEAPALGLGPLLSSVRGKEVALSLEVDDLGDRWPRGITGVLTGADPAELQGPETRSQSDTPPSRVPCRPG